MTVVRGGRNGLTMVELMIVIAVIGIAIALMLAGVQSVRSAASRTQCANNLQQIGLAMIGHLDGHDSLPAASLMEGAMAVRLRQDEVRRIFTCPITFDALSYGYNVCVNKMQQGHDGGKIVAMDAAYASVPFSDITSATWQKRIDPRHKGIMNILYFDGHVEAIHPPAVDPTDSVSGSANVTNFWRPYAGCVGGDDNCGGMAYYYHESTSWTGPYFTRKDATLHCPTGGGVLDRNISYSTPNPNINPGAQLAPFSYRSTGQIRVNQSGLYLFHMSVDDVGELYFNGSLVLSSYGGSVNPRWTAYVPSAPIPLVAGVPVNYELKFTNSGNGPSHISVLWSTPGNPTPAIIPADNLCQ